MYRWSPLNDRQLALLTRIGEGTDPVTSASPELAITARALKGRGLITMPAHGGKWQAEISDDGRFYLEHGHHPDRPAPIPAQATTGSRRADTGGCGTSPSAGDAPVRGEAGTSAPCEAATAVAGGNRRGLDRGGAEGRPILSDPGPERRGAGPLSPGV